MTNRSESAPPRWALLTWASLLALSIIACKSDGQTTATTSSGMSGTTGVGGGASGITGSVNGKQFDSIGAAYSIDKSDDPTKTIVIYVFDQPIACSEITKAGWDTMVLDGTQALEMKLVGKAPGTYPVASTPSPAQGEAAVNYTLTSTTSTPGEVASSQGSVTLQTFTQGGPATGHFDLTFPNGQLTGDFAAVDCALGREP